jgi:hypothetical protein
VGGVEQYEYGNFLQNPPAGSEGEFFALCASRAVYEGVARERVLSLPNVSLRSRQTVTSLLWSPNRSTITGT